MKKKYWDYKQPLFVYILFGLGVIFGMTVFAIWFFIFKWGDIIQIFNEILNRGKDFFAAIGWLGFFLGIIWIIITGQPISILEIPTIGIYFVSLKKDGIYGKTFIQYITDILDFHPRKLASWDEIEKLRFKGRFFNNDGFATRTIFYLRNGKKFVIPNFGFGPAHTDFYSGNDYERRYKCSNCAMYAIIMRKIGREKFVNFPRNLMRDIEEASNNVNDFFENEDKEEMKG
jgi:hypothetical protein